MEKNSKRLIGYVAFFLSCFSCVFADWDPEALEVSQETLEELRQPRYMALKAKVEGLLSGTWCTKEKTHLLMDLVLLTKPHVCVEIGAFSGSSVLPVAATLKYLQKGRCYAIDAWSNEEAIKNLGDEVNTKWWNNVNMREIQKGCRVNFKRWAVDKWVTILSMTSELAIDQINEPIDFLNLDGNFSEIGASKDVALYLPKVRSGGYILLSNLFVMVNGKTPKMKSFLELTKYCDIVCEIERDNAILFRKR